MTEGAALKKKLKRDFEMLVGEMPTWAPADAAKKKKKRRKEDSDDDDDDDDDDEKDDDNDNPLLKRAGNFLYRSKGEKPGFALWARITKNPDVSTGPLPRPFAGGILDYKKCCLCVY